MTFRFFWESILTRADKLLILFLLTTGLSSYIAIKHIFPPEQSRIAIVEVGGEERMRLSLDKAIDDRTINLPLKEGTAYLELAGGRIRVLPMPDHLCSKHICSKTGWIGEPWQVILCVPNKITVRVEGTKKLDDIDLLTQ